MTTNGKWQFAGVVGVDAGMVWIGDPCYCVTPDATEHPAETWDAFCELLKADGFPSHRQFRYRMGHAGLGVCVSTLWGDGEYPVYIEMGDNGRPAAVIVRFDGKSVE